MKSRFVILACASATLVTASTFLMATQTSGTASYSFLNLPVGARATAMGEAFTSVPNDVQGLVYNPAGLATMTASQLSFQHLSYVESITQEAVSYGRAGRSEAFSWGAYLNYLRVGEITRTVSTNLTTGDGFTEEGNFSTYDMALGVSGAAPITDDLKAGMTVKFIRESLADASANAGAFDFGALYRLDDSHSWNLGASLLNMGFSSKFSEAAVKLPTSFRVGTSAQPFSQWLLSSDYVKRVDTSGEINLGVEVTPKRMIALRMGYRYAFTHRDLGGLSDFTAGVGLRIKRTSIDYAFIPLGDLGVSHRISLNFRFNPKRD